jgi:hypothetical protein
MLKNMLLYFSMEVIEAMSDPIDEEDHKPVIQPNLLKSHSKLLPKVQSMPTIVEDASHAHTSTHPLRLMPKSRSTMFG